MCRLQFESKFIKMQSMMLLCLLVFQISYGQHSVCYSNEPPTLVKLGELPIKKNQAYRFKLQNYASPLTIIRNNNGTFFVGNFSKITIHGQRKQYEYFSRSFSFKYPAQHKVANVNNQLLQMQILYDLIGDQSPEWKHKKLAVSITFLLTEHAPQQTFTLGKQISQKLQNDTLFDLKALLRLLPNLNMVLYKGIHSEQPSDSSFLWLVRKQLLLMSQTEFEDVKSFIYQHIARENLNFHGLVSRQSDLNQIQEHQMSNEGIDDRANA